MTLAAKNYLPQTVPRWGRPGARNKLQTSVLVPRLVKQQKLARTFSVDTKHNSHKLSSFPAHLLAAGQVLDVSPPQTSLILQIITSVYSQELRLRGGGHLLGVETQILLSPSFFP